MDTSPSEDGYFGEDVAATYDESQGGRFASAELDATVEVLAGLAGGGRALEFGFVSLRGDRIQFTSVLRRPDGSL